VIIDMAADRGAYICQSQSMNLFLQEPNFGKLTSMHFYAWKKGLKTGMYYLRSKEPAVPTHLTWINFIRRRPWRPQLSIRRQIASKPLPAHWTIPMIVKCAAVDAGSLRYQKGLHIWGLFCNINLAETNTSELALVAYTLINLKRGESLHFVMPRRSIIV